MTSQQWKDFLALYFMETVMEKENNELNDDGTLWKLFHLSNEIYSTCLKMTSSFKHEIHKN